MAFVINLSLNPGHGMLSGLTNHRNNIAGQYSEVVRLLPGSLDVPMLCPINSSNNRFRCAGRTRPRG